ncbi:MAG: hypothetical protein MZV63_64580 [Marinilabiliales bacterium]|nr:hypothetical protein [Marinilabiliales bacterium]
MAVGATATVTVSINSGGQRAGRRDLHRHGDLHEHDQRVRQHDPRGHPDGVGAGCPRSHPGGRPHVRGSRSAVRSRPRASLTRSRTRAGLEHQLDGRQDADLDVALS